MCQNGLSKIMGGLPNHVGSLVWPNPILDDLPVKLQQLDGDDLIYMLTVNRDKRLTYLFSDEAIDLVARWSPVPVYSPIEAYLGKGIVGGKITSGFRQGEQAGQMALRILSGEPARAIPIITHSPNPFIFDHRELVKFGLKEKDLPAKSTILNQPPSIFIRWAKPAALVSGASLVISLILLGMILRQEAIDAPCSAQRLSWIIA